MIKSETVYYFGYGSNMSKSYLTKRRKIIPFESQSAVLKDYQLIMNMEGPNFLEPSFANIKRSRGYNVEGVLHKIDKEDLQKIIKTEGENYQLVKLTVFKKGRKNTAFTLIYITEESKDIPPSKRYLNILVNAAKENNLSNLYIENLKRRPSIYYPILSEIFSLRVYLWVWLRT